MTIPLRPGEPRPPNDPEGPYGSDGSTPPMDGVGTVGDASARIPHIVFADRETDHPDMIAIASRIAFMADVLRTSRSVPEEHHASPDRGDDDGDQAPPRGVHVSHVGETGKPLVLVYDLVGTGMECTLLQLRVELPSATPWHPAVNADPGVHAMRLDRIVEGIRSTIARGPDAFEFTDGRTIGNVVAEHLQWDFPGTLSPFAGIVRTTSFVDGGAEVVYDPRSPSPYGRTPILRPAALAALIASATPRACIGIEERRPVRRYVVRGVADIAAVPERTGDPMERLRLLAAIPDLGENPYTDDFLTLRKSQSR